MTLKTEQNTAEMEHRILEAGEVSSSINGHTRDFSADFEHGQWWLTCLNCGAQWSVVDASGGSSLDGFDFELVSEGDESC